MNDVKAAVTSAADAAKDVAGGAKEFVEEMTMAGVAAANGAEGEDEDAEGEDEDAEEAEEVGGDVMAARRKKLNALRARMVRSFLTIQLNEPSR